MSGNYDKSKTPSERRRTAKGSTIGECQFRHTAQSAVDYEALQALDPHTKAEIMRRALRFAASQPDAWQRFVRELPPPGSEP